jgi:CheY-like chemotaxis protein
MGIAPEMMQHIFEPFVQADVSTTRTHGGSGLGLTISSNLAEMMGGGITVESTPGVGSTFHLTITAHIIRAATTPESAGHPCTAASLPSTATLQERRLLLVDDNTTSCAILERWMQAWGMQVVTTHAAHEALQWLERGDRVDVVLLDIALPELDGLLLARRIQQHHSPQTLPLVLLAPAGLSEAAIHDSGAVIAAIVSRPVKPAHLIHTLGRVLTRQYPADTQPHPNGKPLNHDGTPDTTSQTLAPLRILLAEDNRLNQKIALALLERAGYQADVVVNGREVLEALKQQAYDVILMDVQMPEMDGIEATHYIRRAVPPEQQPCIIAMTAHALKYDRENFLSQGMDDYISKPVKPQVLMDALNRVQQQRQEDNHERNTPAE